MPEERVAGLVKRLAVQGQRIERERQAAAVALEAEQASTRQAREAMAEARGWLGVLQEQAELYWDRKDAQHAKGTDA